MNNDTSSWVLPLLLAVIVAGGAWYYWSNLQKQAAELPPEPVAAVEEETEPQIGPLHPMEVPEYDPADRPELVELPPLGESDQYLKLELTELFGDSVGRLLADSRIIERVVATVDNLPRGHVAERLRPVTALPGAFEVYEESAGQFAISQDSYERYDPLVDIVANVEINELMGLYQRYYPLFQSAYEDLGYPDGYFNDRLVEAIDDMLAAPAVQDPVMLVRPHVMYEFADPDLEARSAGQKLMLRMGGDNAARVREKLEELRAAVAAR